MKPLAVIAVCVAAWMAFLIHPPAVLPLGYLAYVAIAAAMGWSALRHRQPGWGWGAILPALLITLPLWVVGSYLVFAWVVR